MSDLHAVDALSEARGVTHEFLFPFTLRRWAVLGVVVFLMGGFGGLSTPTRFSDGLPSDVEIDGNGGVDIGPIESINLDPVVILALVAAVVALLAIVLLFAMIGSILEFVFVRQLTEQDVRIRGYFGASVRKGVRLLGFRIGLGLLIVVAALLVGLVGLFVLAPLFAPVGPLALLGVVSVALAGIAVVWTAYRFTTDFVVPIMLVDDVGVLRAWGALWEEINADRKQYVAYAVVRFILEIVLGFAAGIGAGLIGVALAIPFLIVAVIAYLALLGSVGPTVGAVLIVGYLLLYVLAFLATVILLLGVPLGTFLRYYSLIVLAETSPAYDMLADVRGTAESDREAPGPRR